MRKEFAERLIELPFQPFQHLDIELYIMGSLSCVATYCNDAAFNGWGETPKEHETIKNNCYIWCSEPVESETIGGLIAWLESCPIWIRATKIIKKHEELLVQYVYC